MCSRCFICINLLNLHTTLCDTVCDFCFTEEELETKRGTVFPVSHTAHKGWRVKCSGCGLLLQNHLNKKAAYVDGTISCCVALLSLPATFTKWSYFILVIALVVKWDRRQSCRFTSKEIMMPRAI